MSPLNLFVDYKEDVPLIGNVNVIFGVFAFAFMVHNVAIEMLKKNKRPKNNRRDLRTSYIITAVIYGVVGILGDLGIAWRPIMENKANIPSTVIDVFTSSDRNYEFYIANIAGFLILFQISAIIPLVFFFSKFQILTLFNGSETDHPAWQNHLMNFSMIVSCLLVEFFNFQPASVIAFNGSVCGLYIVYITPIACHIKCLYPEVFCSKPLELIDRESISNSLIENSLNADPRQSCNDHTDLKSKSASIVILTFYGMLMLIGLFIFAVSIYGLFTS